LTVEIFKGLNKIATMDTVGILGCWIDILLAKKLRDCRRLSEADTEKRSDITVRRLVFSSELWESSLAGNVAVSSLLDAIDLDKSSPATSAIFLSGGVDINDNVERDNISSNPELVKLESSVVDIKDDLK
jgi:hypothetical protein